ncbi:hypothetical protein AC1031_005608 [Aphanomyces cochlioides]|nr:hypothetical protein AC1031_005608 [Aphanomyces cochlioides]
MVLAAISIFFVYQRYVHLEGRLQGDSIHVIHVQSGGTQVHILVESNQSPVRWTYPPSHCSIVIHFKSLLSLMSASLWLVCLLESTRTVGQVRSTARRSVHRPLLSSLMAPLQQGSGAYLFNSFHDQLRVHAKFFTPCCCTLE